MKILKVRTKHVLCDGCDSTDAKHKLKFNNFEDAVYMCDPCLHKLKAAVVNYDHENIVPREEKYHGNPTPSRNQSRGRI